MLYVVNDYTLLLLDHNPRILWWPEQIQSSAPKI